MINLFLVQVETILNSTECPFIIRYNKFIKYDALQHFLNAFKNGFYSC